MPRLMRIWLAAICCNPVFMALGGEASAPAAIAPPPLPPLALR